MKGTKIKSKQTRTGAEGRNNQNWRKGWQNIEKRGKKYKKAKG